MDKFDFGWLVGIYDGEGSVGFSMTKDRDRRYYYPLIQVGSTEKNTVTKIKGLLTDLGIEWRQYDLKPKKPTHSPYTNIVVRDQGAALALSSLMIQMACTKVDQWKTVYKFCTIRVPGTPYTSEEINLYEAAKILNRKGPEGAKT